MSTAAVSGISNVSFDESFFNGQHVSAYIKPLRMHFQRNSDNESPTQMCWDIALQRDSVAVLLYHTSRKQLLLVKQFRPAVFVHRISSAPENVGKHLNEIKWTTYPESMGDTFELCAGLLDKRDKSPLETIGEEILEECGYRVDLEKVRFLRKYILNVGMSGTTEHLFYCEVDEEMRVNNGGGVRSEGEWINKVFLDIADARKVIEVNQGAEWPPTLLYAISWFLNYKS